jgi:LysR family positive regulator for ilvC
MDYDALRMFLSLSQTLHFGRTSRECHISPSALTRLVQRVEREIGWPLLDRDKRSVKLTREGERFALHAREALDRWRSLQEALRGRAKDLAGSISVFASVTACQTFLPRILSAFRQAYPQIHIELETGYAANALEMAKSGAVDVAVAALPDRVSPALVTRVLLYTPLVFVAPASPCEVARLVDEEPLPFAELPIILPATGLARASVDRWFRRKRIHARVYSEVPGSEALLSLVSLGCGVGIVPKLVVDKSPLRGEVRTLDVDPPLDQFRVGVCTQKRRIGSPLVRAFWDSLGPAAAS